MRELVSHPKKCAYCFCDDLQSLVSCKAENCGKYFCNGTSGDLRKSHVIHHAVKSKHTKLEIDIPPVLGSFSPPAAIPVCTKCTPMTNIFNLGVENITSPVNFGRMWCRRHAVEKKLTANRTWYPIVANHPEPGEEEWPFFERLAMWIVPVPRRNAMLEAISAALDAWGVARLGKDELGRIEEFWRSKPQGTPEQFARWHVGIHQLGERHLPTFADCEEYRFHWSPLLWKLSRQEKAEITSLAAMKNFSYWISLPGGTVRVDVPRGLYSDHLEVGRPVRIFNERGWSHPAHITGAKEVWGDHVIWLDFPEKGGTETDLSFKLQHSDANCKRMKNALHRFRINPESDFSFVSRDVTNVILGRRPRTAQLSPSGEQNDANSPLGAPLDQNQKSALQSAVHNPVTLIQGPPGTGKTRTAAAIVYQWTQKNPEKSKILCCAQTNVAVDNLALALIERGLRPLRVVPHPENLQNVRTDLHGCTVAGMGPLDDLNTEADRREYEKHRIDCAAIICCTCNSAGLPALDSFRFKYVLIDEAAQAMELDCLIGITKGCEKLVLVGDHKQLEVCVRFDSLKPTQLSTSLFTRLWTVWETRPETQQQRITLTTQYRMHPGIREMVSRASYDTLLTDHPSVLPGVRPALSDFLGMLLPNHDYPMLFVDVKRNDELSGGGTSYVNVDEALLVAKLVATILKSKSTTAANLGVIAFYNGQCRHIEDVFRNDPIIKNVAPQIEVKTVDGFQGREKDIVILSCVRSGVGYGGRAAVGFTADKKRLNVAMSRAQRAVIVVGDWELFRGVQSWRTYLRFFENVLAYDVCSRIQHHFRAG